MNYNTWTLSLISAGLMSLPALTHAEESTNVILSALSATTISGYVDTSAQWNLGTGNANVPDYSFGGPGKADGFNLNVVKLALEKAVSEADVWGAGYRVDLIFGPDANALATQSSGVNVSDFGIEQAYVALRAPVGNGLNFKIGVWSAIIGYEVFESVNNPNFTRSYGYTIEPTTHTGVHASYQFCEAFSADVCVADTFGPTINGRAFLNGTTSVPATGQGPKAESYKAYMGMVTFTAPTNWGVLAGSTLSGSIVNGFNAASPAAPGNGRADQTSFYAGATLNTPVTGLKVGVAYDYAGVSEQTLTLQRSGFAHVVGLYASYQLTEKLSVYGRGEYANSDVASTFLATKVFEATATLQYDLWKNVLSRIEFRWDHVADGTSPYGGTSPGVGTKKNSYILLANIAYKF